MFRRTVKWRTGCEGRISHLKRNYGWDRAMIDTTEGARIWTGHGVLAHNLAKIALPRQPDRRRPPKPTVDEHHTPNRPTAANPLLQVLVVKQHSDRCEVDHDGQQVLDDGSQRPGPERRVSAEAMQ